MNFGTAEIAKKQKLSTIIVAWKRFLGLQYKRLHCTHCIWW